MFAKGCFLLFVFMVKRRLMIIKPVLECCFAQSDVFLGLMVAGGNRGFVDFGFDLAISVERTLLGYSAVAKFCGCGCFVADNGLVMGVYNPVHIIHTAVTHFNIVTVKCFLENIFFWKMFACQSNEGTFCQHCSSHAY
jgi:hypothetical protein